MNIPKGILIFSIFSLLTSVGSSVLAVTAICPPPDPNDMTQPTKAFTGATTMNNGTLIACNYLTTINRPIKLCTPGIISPPSIIPGMPVLFYKNWKQIGSSGDFSCTTNNPQDCIFSTNSASLSSTYCPYPEGTLRALNEFTSDANSIACIKEIEP